MFQTLLGYTVAKECASPRNSTWFAETVSPCERAVSGDDVNYEQSHGSIQVSHANTEFLQFAWVGCDPVTHPHTA